MAIFRLDKKLAFPDPSYAEKEGILAVGGDLSVDRLILAYANGIFPWYGKGSPILWWSPDPRMVLFPGDLKVSDSMRQLIKSGKYACTFDREFEKVIGHCATVPRKDQESTWITNDLMRAYIRLHREGYAHSVETWYEGKLVGGLYGISLGRAFFGESMFHIMRDASKFALYTLVQQLRKWEFGIIDAQQETQHLKSLGAISISRNEFMNILGETVYQNQRKKETGTNISSMKDNNHQQFMQRIILLSQ